MAFCLPNDRAGNLRFRGWFGSVNNLILALGFSAATLVGYLDAEVDGVGTSISVIFSLTTLCSGFSSSLLS